MRLLKSIVAGLVAVVVTVPFAAYGGWAYIAQGHWNATYIIVSYTVTVLLFGVATSWYWYHR